MEPGTSRYLNTHTVNGLLTPVQVAEVFQVPVRTIRGLARQRKLPAIKVGRLWRFELKEIWKWIESNYQTTPDISEIQQKAKEIVDRFEQL